MSIHSSSSSSVSTLMLAVSILVFFLSLLSSPVSVLATQYYVSSSLGSDSNSGTSPSQAWRSIAKINSILSSLQPGDIIYWCAGDTWQQTQLTLTASGTAAAPITFTSYQCHPGITKKPVLTASSSLSYNTWTVSSSYPNLLVTNMSNYAWNAGASSLSSVWIAGMKYTLARTPNLVDPASGNTYGSYTSEFWPIDAASDAQHIYSASGLTANAYNVYYGGSARVRTANWRYDPSQIFFSELGDLWLNPPLPIVPNTFCTSHFYIDGAANIALTDQIGEWYYDPVYQQLYVYPMTSAIRAQMLAGNISVWVIDTGAGSVITNRANYITIDGLSLIQAPSGIQGGNTGFTLQNSVIAQITGQAIYISSGYQILIANNIIWDVASDCMVISAPQSLIIHNEVIGCGLYAGYGTGWTGITVAYATVKQNLISNIGYSGIIPTQGATIDGNTVSNTMMALNDGGAIYCQGAASDGVTIINNVVNNVIGNIVSSNPWPLATCIYFDGGSMNVWAQNNSCNNAQQCLQVDLAVNLTFISNACYSPGIYLANVITDSTFAGNLVYTSGTNVYWQNPLVRIWDLTEPNFNGLFTMYQNTYCQTGGFGTYTFQAAGHRWNDFPSYQQGVIALGLANSTFEQGSSWYIYNCPQQATQIAMGLVA